VLDTDTRGNTFDCGLDEFRSEGTLGETVISDPSYAGSKPPLFGGRIGLDVTRD